jgi:hypothetical protein
MLSRIACSSIAVRSVARRSLLTPTPNDRFVAARPLGTVAGTISDALKYSGYSSIDFTIPEDAPTYDAVQKFAAFNIGCLVTTDKAGECHVSCVS